jgi:hypothetical protein
MTYVLIIGLLMVLFNILMSYVELKPFLAALEYEKSVGSKFTLIFRCIGHLPKIIPSLIDIGAMILMTKLFDLGNGYAGGVTGLFASNVLSIIIYFYVRRNNHPQEENSIEITKGLS